MALTKRYILAITGASGALLAKRAITILATYPIELNLVVSANGEKVYQYEVGESLQTTLNTLQKTVASIIVENNDNLFASIASGSYKTNGMIILPCSVSTVAKMAVGIGDNLICRAAAVCIKEKRPLIISPREAPLSAIVLSNLLTLSQNGVTIMPPFPAFYDKTENFDTLMNSIVGRLLATLGMDNNLYQQWQQPNIL